MTATPFLAARASRVLLLGVLSATSVRADDFDFTFQDLGDTVTLYLNGSFLGCGTPGLEVCSEFFKVTSPPGILQTTLQSFNITRTLRRRF
jgi:hypothetical protein